MIQTFSFKASCSCLLIFVFSLFSCDKQESIEPSTFSEIKEIIVYDRSGKETTITGNVIAIDKNVPVPYLELGTIKDGILDLTFPDFPPGQENRFFDEVGLPLPVLEISPQDSTWFIIDDSKTVAVLTDEEVPGIFDPRSTTKQNYVLEFHDKSGEFELWFTFFTKDTTVKSKGTFFGLTYDVDINASRGWNIISAKNTSSDTIIKTSLTGISDIKCVAIPSSTDYQSSIDYYNFILNLP